jgi:hypothetical protein
MTNYKRGIPSVSDYSHWNEDAELMWYQENRYDMMHGTEYDYEDDDDYYPEDYNDD